ncbi:MAG: metal-dependent hydrolase [Nitrospirota bacterium]|nr:metal-dependent hydrolase [Nitrospirota bacterium]
MSPITHFLTGWAVANTARLGRRDRLLVTLAAVLPDADGLGVLLDLVRRNSANAFEYYQRFHHVLFHNLFFGIALAIAALAIGARKRMAAGLVFLAFHLHLLEDIVGSRGLGDDFWSFPYLKPFSAYEFVWKGQWPLNGWQNFIITGALMALMFYLAWKRGQSPIAFVSTRADAAFVQVLRDRFGAPAELHVS